MNGKLVSIGHDVIGKIKEGNTDVFRNGTEFDLKIFHALLVICIGNEAIAIGDVSEKVMKFIRGRVIYIKLHIQMLPDVQANIFAIHISTILFF